MAPSHYSSGEPGRTGPIEKTKANLAFQPTHHYSSRSQDRRLICTQFTRVLQFHKLRCLSLNCHCLVDSSRPRYQRADALQPPAANKVMAYDLTFNVCPALRASQDLPHLKCIINAPQRDSDLFLNSSLQLLGLLILLPLLQA